MTLKTQLFILSVSMGALIIIVFDIMFYTSVKKTIIQEVHNHLESVSQLKEEKIERFILDSKERISMIVNRPFLIEGIDRVLSKGDKSSLDNVTLALNETSEAVKDIHDIHITDLNGTVRISTDASQMEKSLKDINSFGSAMNGIVSVHELYKRNGKLWFYHVTPLYFRNSIIGVMIINCSGESFLDINRDYTGLGRTGETVIVKRFSENKVVFMTSLRFDPTAALAKVIPFDTNLAAVKSLLRKQGIDDKSKDYRNEEVLAVTRYIPETGWGIVTKIDKKEALEPVSKTRNDILMISLGMGLIVLILTWAFGNYLVSPLHKLIDFTATLKRGNYQERLLDLPSNEIGILGNTFNDLSQRLEISREETNKTLIQLKKSNEALNNFAYTITHDLKSPLSSMEGLVNILEIENSKTGTDDTFIQLIKTKVTYMGEMIAKVLEYAKAGSSDAIDKELIPCATLLKEVMANVIVPANITVHVNTDLPSVVYPKVPLFQIFENLISNAVKYMDKPKGKIVIAHEDRGSHWLFCLSDNGRGIEEEDFDKIFLMLKKITKEKIESTGIGLATVKKIIHENGGDIWVRSVVGKETTFYFTIPKIDLFQAE